jgi:hypothetical protein
MSNNGHNIFYYLTKSLKIFGLPKYRVCGAIIHNAYFFFHWIEFKDLYETNIILFYTHTHTHTYIHTYKQRILVKVTKQIIQTVFDDRVLYIHVVIGRQTWHFGFQRSGYPSSSLFEFNIEVSFI